MYYYEIVGILLCTAILPHAVSNQDIDITDEQGEIAVTNPMEDYLWKMPYLSYTNHALLLQFEDMSMKNEQGDCLGDIIIGKRKEPENNLICNLPLADCRVYGMVSSDFTKIKEYVGRKCKAWHIEQVTVANVQARVFEASTLGITIKIRYKYFNLAELNPEINCATEVNKESATMEGNAGSGANTNGSDNFQVYTAIIVVLILITLIVSAALVFEIHRRRKLLHQQNGIRFVNESRPTEQSSNIITSVGPYATIGDVGQSEFDHSNVGFEDIPSTSSVLATSNVPSEPYYQFPTRNYTVEIEAESQSMTGPSAEVYAVVNKDRKPTA